MTLPTIIYLHPHFTLNGGAGKFALETAKLLAERGYRVIIVSLQARPEVIQPYSKTIIFHDLGGPLSSSLWHWLTLPLTMWRVFRFLDKYPDSIVFPQVFPANWWGFWYKVFRPHRTVVWMCQEPSAFIHSDTWVKALPHSVVKVLLISLRPLLKVIDVWLAQHCDFVFCNSNYTLSLAQKTYRYTADQAATLYLGIDTKVFKPLKMTRQNKIVCVSRLTKFKNLDVVLQALVLLNHTRHQPVHLTIIGDGEEKSALQKLTTQLGLTDQVTFLGHVPSIQTVVTELNTAKAFVQASIGEPFGLAPVEAMGCGTPAIVSNTGGMTETVLNGQTGFHFKGGDPHDLCRVLEVVMNDQKVFQKLSAQAIRRAHQFTWQKTTDQIDEKLQSLK